MKKIIASFLFFFLIVPFGRTQDTIQYMDPNYLFNERHPYTFFPIIWGIPLPNWTWNSMCAFTVPCETDVCSRYHSPNAQEPTMVYGVALTVNVMSEDEMAKYPYEIILARIENNALVFIDSTTWDHQKDSKEWFKYTYLGDGVLYERVVPSYEFYFDTPHLISDTFYVGFRRTVPLYQNDDNMMFIMYLSFDSINSMSTEWMCFNWVNWAITETFIISP